MTGIWIGTSGWHHRHWLGTLYPSPAAKPELPDPELREALASAKRGAEVREADEVEVQLHIRAVEAIRTLLCSADAASGLV
ncbi:MAG TPA: hypothetical protein VH601_06395 [Bryobacteraceae bacterium]